MDGISKWSKIRGKLGASALAAAPKKLKRRIDERIMEMAIERAKATIAAQGLDPEDLSEEQREIVVSDEERKIRDGLKLRGLVGILLILGIPVI
ncbi:MAG: dihydrouridine synthase [Gammaproteobacteria bacterium AqS3]|nr:dihydrouridine synthase [Gammaproteobacteria bacterium AqS3]